MSRSLLAVISLGLATGCQGSSPSPANVSSSDASGFVAKWNGGAISSAELDAQIYEQRKQTLEQLLFRKLLEQKAKAEGLAPEELMKREVMSKENRPSDAEMKRFYDEQAKQQKLPPFDQIKDQIAQYMERPALQAAQQAFSAKLKKDYAVVTTLKPPRVEVAAEGPAKGPATAPVTIVEFSDFQCPFCSRAEEVVSKVLKAYDGKVRLVYRDFPLPFHPQAEKASEAAHCAMAQGKYWEMHEKLFANQKALEPTELGLDQSKFDKCLDSGQTAKAVAANRSAGEKAGVTGTPAFFVNGYELSGAQPFEEFKNLIDGELAQVARK